MPADFLRDVVRPPRSKRSRVWSMVPLSIAAHALGGLAFLIIPLAAEEDPPPPAPLARTFNIMTARPIPPPPAAVTPRATPAARDASAAPTVIPDAIAPEPEVAPSGTGDTPTPGGLGVADGVLGGVDLGARIGAPTPPPPPQRRLPVKPGGEIREPQKIRHVPPIYPQIAVSAGVQGIVILEATISEAGTIENLRVLKSHPLLERAAIEAVKQWRYTPTRLNGVPVPIIMTVTVNFMLQR
jgi:periplasmic protein TonB